MCHPPNQPDVKLKIIATWSFAFSRTSSSLLVFTLKSHCWRPSVSGDNGVAPIDAFSVVRVERKKPNTITSFVRIPKQVEPSIRWELAVYFLCLRLAINSLRKREVK